MLMQFDSFRGELDWLAQQIMSGARPPRPVPMDAYRRGDEFVVSFRIGRHDHGLHGETHGDPGALRTAQVHSGGISDLPRDEMTSPTGV